LTFFGVSLLATSSPLDCAKTPGPSCANEVVLLDGTVLSGVGSGAAAIAGADVTIYQARGGSPRVLATGTSDGNGNFSIALLAKDNDSIRYAVARKGKNV